ncbi:MAG: hypothetical protein ACKO85_16745 [Isosphaeraceae bacterium]
MEKDAGSNRSQIRRIKLGEGDDDGLMPDATPAERMLMVWPLTQAAWAFLEPDYAKREFQRHVVSLKRLKN